MDSFLYSLKHKIYEQIALFEWKLIRGKRYRIDSLHREVLLVLPADPITLVGSKGEVAMLAAVRDYAKSCGYGRIMIQTATDTASEAAQQIGYEPLQTWRRGWGLRKTVQSLLNLRPGALVVLGADMLDGHYSPAHAVRVLGAAHVASKLGVKTAISGFSFNASPAPVLIDVFRNLHEGIEFCLRDDVSLERFVRLTGRNAVGVADVAFLLQKKRTENVDREVQRIDLQRASGKTVLALNAHPMLLGRPNNEELENLLDSLSVGLSAALKADVHSLFMFPHDTRGSVGDTEFLSALKSKLAAVMPALYVDQVDSTLSADEVKAVVASFDGVITGRMHLGIASLGSGVPIMALEYQGKFAGLLKKFAGTEMRALPKDSFMNGEVLSEEIQRLLATLPQKKERLAQELQEVRRAAERSLMPLQ